MRRPETRPLSERPFLAVTKPLQSSAVFLESSFHKDLTLSGSHFPCSTWLRNMRWFTNEVETHFQSVFIMTSRGFLSPNVLSSWAVESQALCSILVLQCFFGALQHSSLCPPEIATKSKLSTSVVLMQSCIRPGVILFPLSHKSYELQRMLRMERSRVVSEC